MVDPTIVSRLFGARREQGPLDDATKREREVLALMAEGHSNPAIGAPCSSARRRSKATSARSS